MGSAPRVTVVIPTRNRLGLLREAIASVRSQVDASWELIVVDDASSDGTRDFLEAQDDIRSVLLARHHERSAARNAGVALAEGHYVFFLDSDDRLAPGGLATLVRYGDECGECAVVGGWSYVPGSSGPMRLFNTGKHATASWQEVLFGWTPQLGQVLATRSAVESTGGFDLGLTFAEDLDFLLKLARTTPLLAVPDVVLEYRAHPGQARPQDAETIDASVRRRFVDSLHQDARRTGEAILESRTHFVRGHGHYVAHRYRSAAVELASALRASRPMMRSPLLRSYLIGLCLKSSVLALLPKPIAAKARSRLGRGRGAS